MMERQAKKQIVAAIERVAKRLGNTKAVCRKCYVHPDVISSYLDGTLIETLKSKAEQQLRHDVRSLRPEEAAVLGLLQQRLVAEQRREKSLPKLLRQSIAAVKKDPESFVAA